MPQNPNNQPAFIPRSPERPNITDPKLDDIICAAYYLSTRYDELPAPCSLADTARYELWKGETIGGKNHRKKAYAVLNRLDNWLTKRANRDSPEREIAMLLYNDFAEALGEKVWKDE